MLKLITWRRNFDSPINNDDSLLRAKMESFPGHLATDSLIRKAAEKKKEKEEKEAKIRNNCLGDNYHGTPQVAKRPEQSFPPVSIRKMSQNNENQYFPYK